MSKIRDWEVTPSGEQCAWCLDDNSEFEPADSDDAEMFLCRGHLAEFEGTSLDGLDRMDADIHADMVNLGYFD